MAKLLIYTDLDGTLLDHYTYRFDPALSAIEMLEERGIPWILNTSKTFSELQDLRLELSHHHPFIVENGSAIYIPKTSLKLIDPTLTDKGNYWCMSFGPSRQELITVAKQFKERFRFTGFSELSTQDVVDLTGLGHDSAVLAMEREFTEPLIWNGTDAELAEFAVCLEPKGIQIQRGGRFVHMMGRGCDKSLAMGQLTQAYQTCWDELVTTVALGDGENDVGMLRVADIPVVVRSPVHAPPEIRNRNDACITEKAGPEGWNEALTTILLQEER